MVSDSHHLDLMPDVARGYQEWRAEELMECGEVDGSSEIFAAGLLRVFVSLCVRLQTIPIIGLIQKQQSNLQHNHSKVQ